MASYSHWGLVQVVECDGDLTDLPQIDGVVIQFPTKRAKASRRHSIKLAQSGSTE